MNETTKMYLYAYLALLAFLFIVSGSLGVIEHRLVYNITCDNGDFEEFNESTLIVCGEENPLHLEQKVLSYDLLIEQNTNIID